MSETEDGYVLRLFVTGATPKSTQAIGRIKAICEEYLEGHYELEVIDLYQQPELAMESQIIAAPTLIKESPLPAKKLVGDMSNTARVLQGLEIPTEE